MGVEASAVDGPFSASIIQEVVGPIRLSRIKVGGDQCISRRKQDIVRSSVEQFELVYFRICDGSLRHAGQDTTLRSGHCVLIDGRKEYVLDLRGVSENLSLHIPARWLESRTPNPQRFLGLPIAGDVPWGRSLIALLDAIYENSPAGNELDHLCAEQVAGALSLAILPPRHRIGPHADSLYKRLRQALCDLSHDTELSAAVLATELGISVRYVHALFSQAGTTYGHELQSIRVNSAARMLRDVRFKDISINEVAFRAGYSEPSHFSRRFREAFGITPAVYRSQMLR